VQCQLFQQQHRRISSTQGSSDSLNAKQRRLKHIEDVDEDEDDEDDEGDEFVRWARWLAFSAAASVVALVPICITAVEYQFDLELPYLLESHHNRLCPRELASVGDREWAEKNFSHDQPGFQNVTVMAMEPETILSGGFSDVLLIITRAYAHAMPYLQYAYRPHFWDVLFLQPRMLTEATKFQFNASDFAIEICDNMPHLIGCQKNWCEADCPKDPFGKCYDSMYICVARVLFALMEPPRGEVEAVGLNTLRRTGRDSLRGVLVIHADAWLTPFFGVGLNLSRIIYTPTYHPACEANTSIWASLREEATENLQKEFGRLPALAHCTCGMWVDLHYVPQKAWLPWARAAIPTRSGAPLLCIARLRSPSLFIWPR